MARTKQTQQRRRKVASPKSTSTPADRVSSPQSSHASPSSIDSNSATQTLNMGSSMEGTNGTEQDNTSLIEEILGNNSVQNDTEEASENSNVNEGNSSIAVKLFEENHSDSDVSKSQKIPVEAPKKNERKLSQRSKILKEIRFFRRTNHKLVPKLAFCRLVKEIVSRIPGIDETLRIQTLALEALHEAAESFLVRFFEESNLCAFHSRRVTVMRKDMKFLKVLKYRTGYPKLI
ncbi:uncharacterized protein [Clytia hemisphaerica]|uniref:Core Histone H2A/H2B/H3 domain-containing protein n=1 Tax=Clytia hemisphaerica TaxID=252671 RepID=A0A7M5XD74_9CNID|eukprot:TCONS_00050004-protein